jgi:CHASE2 domain-containing sensor protein
MNKLKKIFTHVLGCLLTLALLLGMRIWDPSFVESVRLRYFDTLITSKPTTQNNLWVVNIDEAAIDHHGQWPFARGMKEMQVWLCLVCS